MTRKVNKYLILIVFHNIIVLFIADNVDRVDDGGD
jgi:hypothetical protein